MIKYAARMIPLVFLFMVLWIPSAVFANETELKTGFEIRDGEEWTTIEEEQEFIEELSSISDKVSFINIWDSVEGRPINLVSVGNFDISEDDYDQIGRSMFVMGTPHGNEPSGREMALKLMRDLAFTDDPELLNLLDKATVLIMPTPNPDGRVRDQRRNAWSLDNNRDNLSLHSPEQKAVAWTLNTFKPDLSVDAHERPTGTEPDQEFTWPVNLNVHPEVRALSQELTLNHLIPEVAEDGFTTGIYRDPDNPRSGSERMMSSMSGLRNGLGILTETAGQLPPEKKVDVQVSSIYSVLDFYNHRFEDIGHAVENANNHRFTEDDTYHITIEEEITPACGYMLNNDQFEAIERHIDLFSLENERITDETVFITMDQPMNKIIPLLLDDRALFNEVNGKAVLDCSDLPSISPPEPDPVTGPAQYNTDFSDTPEGELPEDWTQIYSEGNWKTLKNPDRLQINNDTSGRKALVWDEVGYVYGDVELTGVVRAMNTGDNMVQVALNMSGDTGAVNMHYLILNKEGEARIQRMRDNGYLTVGSTELPFSVEENKWYQIVMEREGIFIWVKIWPYGDEEPQEWQLEVADLDFFEGQVGFTVYDRGTINEWAYFGAGTGGMEAPRAPADLLPDVDKSLLELKITEIEKEVLEDRYYSPESWSYFQEQLSLAKSVLRDEDADQTDVDQAIENLTAAYEGLEGVKAQYWTNFSEYETGQQPGDWTMLWRDGSWTAMNEPSRLKHEVVSSGRQGLTWDEVGEVYGDVEVAGVVTSNGSAASHWQFALHMSGEAEAENYYYITARDTANGTNVRLNRVRDHYFLMLDEINLPYSMDENEWYQVVLNRTGDRLSAKVWPYGEEEPADWQLTAEDSLFDSGKVGIAHLYSGAVSEWAYYGVGIGGMGAPRAPEDLFDPDAVSAASIITRIGQFEEAGSFENDQVVRSLTLQLTAVDQYETQEEGEKVVGHMESFKLLLDHMEGQMSEKVYESLYADAASLIAKWE
ncbi:M14 family zinc carboxypeptidase [Virgibacillus sp. YIM 98842]|uniref:M14 family zinc carboxypeptidase n=1 Tax=Virgibacillus sp. YIM 98842 TaxID=2663533 RepID=UPI0013DD6770|nr:M14 family zinc carboxypeptidase [Virgibacillus sp. YIM 98842]